MLSFSESHNSHSSCFSVLLLFIILRWCSTAFVLFCFCVFCFHSSLCTRSIMCLFSWTGRRGTLTFTTTACRISRPWALTISAWTAGWPVTAKTRQTRAGLAQITKRTSRSIASRCRPLAAPLSQSCQRRLEHTCTRLTYLQGSHCHGKPGDIKEDAHSSTHMHAY